MFTDFPLLPTVTAGPSHQMLSSWDSSLANLNNPKQGPSYVLMGIKFLALFGYPDLFLNHLPLNPFKSVEIQTDPTYRY